MTTTSTPNARPDLSELRAANRTALALSAAYNRTDCDLSNPDTARAFAASLDADQKMTEIYKALWQSGRYARADVDAYLEADTNAWIASREAARTSQETDG